MADLKLALRTLFKTPFVTIIAALSLALGIGANAAIYSMFEQILRRPLPVWEPERLVNLAAPGPKPGSQSCGQAGDCDAVFSYPMFRDLEEARTGFAGVAAHMLFGANIAFQRQTLNGEAVFVSGSYFPVLGLQPALGRLFTRADDQTVGGHFIAVLSYDYWENRLAADRAILGESIIVNGHPFTIVGVAPRGFHGTTLGAKPHVFVPVTMRGVLNPGFRGFENRRSYWAYVFARLQPGMSLEQATAAANAAYRPIINDVEAPLQEGMSEQGMTRFRARELVLEDGRRGQSSVHEQASTPLVLLFAITGVVLLIACANIANLMLARGANRSMEMAVRLSLGATRGQLLRQLLTESVLLALIGGAASLLIAHWTLGLITGFLPGEAVESMTFAIGWPVVAFAAALSIGTGLLFGLFPALHSTRPDLVATLRANTGKMSGAKGASRFRTVLVTAQIALSMALLISAGLFIRSLQNVSRVDLGLRVDNLVTFAVSPRLNGYDPRRSAVLFARLEEELAAVPGVSGVTGSMVPLLAGSNWGNNVSVQGFVQDADTDANSRFNQISTAYFRTLGIPMLAGRDFTQADAPGASRVAIVNEAFAEKFGLGRDAVGKRMATGRTEDLDIEIVGLVRNAKYSEVKQQVPPLYFMPYRQDTTVGRMYFYARTSMAPEQVLRAIPPLVASLDPDLPVEDLKTMPQQVRENVFLDRMISSLAAAFALLATLLAAVGLYGVLAYSVTLRTKEIGVRMALGADEWAVRRMVLRHVALMTVVGGALGAAGAVGLGRAARSLLFELEGHDPLSFALAVVVLAVVALAAAYFPAARASRVDPMQALRYE